MTCILGIDPGTRATGYGIIRVSGARTEHVAHGIIRTDDAHEQPQKLLHIFNELSLVIEQYQPQEIAIEKVFMKRYVDAALKLGQARGAAVVAAARAVTGIAEYTPAEVKKAIVGRGAADKTQIEHMVRVLLRLPEKSATADAADALAIALTHAHLRESTQRLKLACIGVGLGVTRWRR